MLRPPYLQCNQQREASSLRLQLKCLTNKKLKIMATLGEIKNLVKKEESTFNMLVRRNTGSSVIEEQKKTVESLKADLEAAENTPAEKAIKSKATEDFITFCVNEPKIEKVSKKIAFVKHNRPINTKRVDQIIYSIAQGKYEKAFSIIVAEAEKLIKRKYTVFDVNGNVINETEAADYYVFIDGQHRGTAFAKLAAVGEDIEIPNVYIRDIENVGQYLVDINENARSWDNKDKYSVAGLTTKDEVFSTISEKIGEGFNPSTAALIYSGKKLTTSLLNKVLKGEEAKLPKGANFNKERGEKFITLCKAVGMEVSLITKRYYIEGFNSFAASTNEESAFGALKEIGKQANNLDKIKAVKDSNDFIKLLKEAAH